MGIDHLILQIFKCSYALPEANNFQLLGLFQANEVHLSHTRPETITGPSATGVNDTSGGSSKLWMFGDFFCISVQLSGAKLLKSKKWEEHLHIKQEDIVMPLD